MAVTHPFHEPKTHRVPYPKAGVRAAQASAASTVHKDLHPSIYKAYVVSWAALIGVFLATFAESPFTLFMLGIVIFYATMFFGVPYVLSCVKRPGTRAPKVSLYEFLRGRVESPYGPVSGMEALVQVLMVPVTLTLGALLIGFIVHFEADHIHMLYIGQTAAYPQ